MRNMYVKDLRELIKDLPANMEVVIQKEAGSKIATPLLDVDKCYYEKNGSVFEGTAYPTHFDSVDAEQRNHFEWLKIKGKGKVLLLKPIL